MTHRLTGKVALVTGGASGIGEGAVRRLVAEGARVLVADVQDDEGRALAAEFGESAVFRHCDVALEDEVRRRGRRCRGAVRTPRHHVQQRGSPGGRRLHRPVAHERCRSHLRGRSSRGVPGDEACGESHDPAGSGIDHLHREPRRLSGGIGPHAYSAAKAGVIGLTQSVAAELRYHRVRCNAVVPGAVVSAMTADLVVGDATDLQGTRRLLSAENDVAGRPGLPSDIAAAVVFLASDESVFVTGSALVVDGGTTFADGPADLARGAFADPQGVMEAGRRS